MFTIVFDLPLAFPFYFPTTLFARLFGCSWAHGLHGSIAPSVSSFRSGCHGKLAVVGHMNTSSKMLDELKTRHAEGEYLEIIFGRRQL